jgi:hypothetical protein
MTPADQRLVAEDLVFLRDWGGQMKDDEIRRGTATLRRLLVEGVYGAAWRAAGLSKQPYVSSVDLDKSLSLQTTEKVVFALACGAELRGLRTGPLVITEAHPSTTHNMVAQQYLKHGAPAQHEFSLSSFLSAPRAYAFGERLSRADVVKYLANVRGGVHLSASQTRRESELVKRVQVADNQFIIFGTEGLIREVVVIAQDVGRSKDADAYVRRVVG